MTIVLSRTFERDVSLILGQELERWRRKRDLSQHGLSIHIPGMGDSKLYGMYETGARPLSVARLFSVATVLDVPPEVIIRDTDNRVHRVHEHCLECGR
jgi:transcriptional regulator with XRE-family HTH domain